MVDKQFEILCCPDCQANGQPCRLCGGVGYGAWLDGRWLYAEPNLSILSLSQIQANQKVATLINRLLYTAAGLGLLGSVGWLGFNAWSATEGVQDLLSLISQPSYAWLVWWLGVMLMLWTFYRLTSQSDSRKKIKAWKYKSVQNDWPKTGRASGSLNVIEGWNDNLQKTWYEAVMLARQWNHAEVGALHWLAALVRYDAQVQAIFSRLRVSPEKLFEKMGHQLGRLERGKALKSAMTLKKMLIASYIKAYQSGQVSVSALELCSELWDVEPLVDELLYDLGADQDKWNNVIVWLRLNRQLIANYLRYRKLAGLKPSGNMDRAYTALATPLLNSYADDLTVAAKYGQLDICVGRESELQELFANLQAGKLGTILVGEAGVGKRELVYGLAQLMVTEEVPATLGDKRLLELDLASLLAGATAAVAQEKMMTIINEIIRAGNIVLFVPEIENLMGLTVGNEGSLELAEILANAVARSGLVCVATASPEHYRRYIEGSALAQQFAKLEINEPSGNQAIQMIESKLSWLESRHKVYVAYEAIEAAVEMSDRYMHESFLPAKAIDLLEKAAANVAGKAGVILGAEAVASELSKLTHIKVEQVTGNEGAELLQLEQKMHERMIGQAEAVSLVSQSLRRARAELRSGKRPIASFLFLGPTGVGKTELAKTLAAVYFGGEEYMIRLDMSEYQASDALAKMIGADGQSGYLTEKVRALPFTLVLLDEIEKAHPEVLNLFLQVLDDGRLTDGLGRTIDFTNTIIIATSNIGANYIQEAVKQQVDLEMIKKNIIEQQLAQHMRPELINRFDGIVVFKPLAITEVAQIARLMINNLAQTLADKGIVLAATELGLQRLAQLAYQPEFGARPLRRLVQDRIENEIANLILAGKLGRRDRVVINDQAGLEVVKAREI